MPSDPGAENAPYSAAASAAVDVLPGGYGRSALVVGAASPRAVVRAEGARIQDVDGRWLLDANMNFAVLVLGHAHPAVVKAASDAVERGSCYGLPHGAERELAQHLVGRIAHAEQVKLTNSGTEAVMLACRVARAHTGRRMVLGVAGAYHGSSDLALALRTGGRAAGVTAGVNDDVVTVPLNDIDALRATVATHKDELAAVLVDLLPNYAGLVRLSDSFVSEARRLCDETGALLIFDEVISFRLRYGGFQTAYGVDPDLTILGKAIGGGLPIGGIVGASAFMEPLDPFSRGAVEGSGTFTGNPVSASAGLASLREYDADAIAWSNSLGKRLREGLLTKLPTAWEVRGEGSLARVVRPGASLDDARAFWWRTHDRGALLMPSGMMAVPSVFDEGVVDELVDILVDAAAA